MSKVTNRDRRLYNPDLAPTPSENKNWGSFEIFNVWANDVQSYLDTLWLLRCF